MIKPIQQSVQVFRADKDHVDKSGDYIDPLMRWPLRGAAFTNEVGEALRPLIGGYATLTWAPALLYIGADVYDKYKNDQTEYSPDSHRCLKQAIFQGLASILLPIVAVKMGQNIFSLFGLASKDNITINVKEHINDLAQNFVANGKMRAYSKSDKECINAFKDIVNNNLDFKQQREKSSNPFKQIFYTVQDKFYKLLGINSNKKINSYSEETIKTLISMRKNLLSPDELFEKSKWYSLFKTAVQDGQTENVAVKTVLDKYLKNNALKGRFIKTIGGFIALGMAIKPIDNFVEHVLIGKYVAPELEKIKKPTI